MSISALLTGALFVATASSAQSSDSSHPGKTKSTSNYAVSHEGMYIKEDEDNADDTFAFRAQYITGMKSLRSAPISSSPTAPQDFRKTSTASIRLMAG